MEQSSKNVSKSNARAKLNKKEKKKKAKEENGINHALKNSQIKCLYYT